ncbi:MAG: hypothetical protein PUC11_00220 [Elusimicrobia bacterium]|nr:hypothetical protein [Elusimicrobiota bacterium]
MKKARICLLGLVLFCSACAAPSLRYKKEVNSLIAAGKFNEAEQRVVSKKNKLYSRKDATLFYLDRAILLHDAGDASQSDQLFAAGQANIDELYAKSVSASLGRFLINDLTTPYYAPAYEQALTYYYRALNFLQTGDVSSAAVEARRAVFFLDHLRAEKKKGYNDDPFVQYFASLVFESVGQLSDARIARTNAFNAYARLGAALRVSSPDFPVPANAARLGEIIVIHSNGLMPLKKSDTLQVAWDRAVLLASTAQEGENVSPEVQNAVYAGLAGNAVTLSFPSFERQPYRVAISALEAGGQTFYTQKVADFAAAARLDLEEKMPGILFRTATRAVVKEAAAVQARHAAAQAAKDDTVGELAGMFVSALGAAVEKADTRQWFTLPAEVRMARAFVPPGEQNIRLLLRDGYGNIVGERVFENVRVQRGGRVFLHVRTAY